MLLPAAFGMGVRRKIAVSHDSLYALTNGK
jgi:hypothetical protein